MDLRNLLRIAVAKNEQQPLTFRQFPDVLVEPATLQTGDYSIVGYEDRIAIERKHSLDEICSNIGKGRERFERDLERAKNFDRFYLLIEGNPADFMLGGWERSHLPTKSAFGSIAAWDMEYNLRYAFCSSRITAEMIIVHWFRKYLKHYKKEVV